MKNTIQSTQNGLLIKNVYWERDIPVEVTQQKNGNLIWTELKLDELNFVDVGSAVVLEDVNNSLVIEVSGSYWGTTDLETIGNLITDNADDYTLGIVSAVNPVSSLIDISAD